MPVLEIKVEDRCGQYPSIGRYMPSIQYGIYTASTITCTILYMELAHDFEHGKCP